MTNPVPLQIKCEDFLKDNSHLFAHKARRKKIALIRVEAAADSQSAEVHIDLGNAKLSVGEMTYNAEPPDCIIRKFSEFTWDFLVYLVLDFNPVLAVVDVMAFLSGPLYNRRLKKQLRLLTVCEMVLKPGEHKTAILAFRGGSSGAGQLHLDYRVGNGEPLRIACEIL